MIVLDTNVVSEFMRDHPRPEVLAWLDQQLANTLFVTAVTEAEVRSGIALLPSGRRRCRLAAAAERAFGVLFAERILPFDKCGRPHICGDRGGPPCRWPADQSSRLPDRRHCAFPRGTGCDKRCGRLCQLWGGGNESVVGRVEGAPAYTRLFWAKAALGQNNCGDWSYGEG